MRRIVEAYDLTRGGTSEYEVPIQMPWRRIGPKLLDSAASELSGTGWGVRMEDDRMQSRTFGNIAGITPGERIYASRKDIAEAGIHKPLQAGISGSGEEGADSIVVSGGYEDDEDLGDTIIYTGEGGRDPTTGRQTQDQKLTSRNLALARNSLTGLPVRVVRKVDGGYRYDGLFDVEEYWAKRGRSGHRIYQFRLVQSRSSLGFTGIGPKEGVDLPPGADQPAVRSSLVTRTVRDTAVGMRVKQLYGCRCQVCDTRLETPAGPYAESAHIKPLGRPHNGPDVPGNVLCLCPNHHVLLDAKAFTIRDDFSLVGIEGSLSVHPRHTIEMSCLRYHRSQYSGASEPAR